MGFQNSEHFGLARAEPNAGLKWWFWVPWKGAEWWHDQRWAVLMPRASEST